MKIEPGRTSFGNQVQRNDPATGQNVQHKSFSDMMQQNNKKADQEQLKRMLEQIHLHGQRLTHSLTVRDLRAYKLLVKQFLEETVRRGIILKDTKGWDRRGRAKRYKLLEEVDRLLLELGEELLQSEEGHIDLLARIGEIRGMLLNVYF